MEETDYVRELTEIFNDKNYDVTWINELQRKRGWNCNNDMFHVGEMCKILGPKSACEIVKNICSVIKSSKSIELYIHVLDPDVYDKYAPDKWPENTIGPAVLYYNYDV